MSTAEKDTAKVNESPRIEDEPKIEDAQEKK